VAVRAFASVRAPLSRAAHAVLLYVRVYIACVWRQMMVCVALVSIRTEVSKRAMIKRRDEEELFFAV